MTYRQALINKCTEFRKTARPLIPWEKTCEQLADEKISTQKPGIVAQAGIKPNRTLIILAGFAIAGVILARVIK